MNWCKCCQKEYTNQESGICTNCSIRQQEDHLEYMKNDLRGWTIQLEEAQDAVRCITSDIADLEKEIAKRKDEYAKKV